MENMRMDARRIGIAAWLWVWTLVPLWAQPGGARVNSENFIVVARTPELAQEVSQVAENFRRELAVYWLGQPLPNWPRPCPIRVMAAPNRGAGGKTTFTLIDNSVTDWSMEVEGSRERILDSVLPHEITHTIFATYFSRLGKPVPRWADEGACTTVEHASERSKHDDFLVRFIGEGRALPFATMFTLRDYPRDIMPLYAQGYSVASFLIAQGGPRRFVAYLEDGMRTEDWVGATERAYGYPRIGKLQVAWNKWVGNGGGPVEDFSAIAMGHRPSAGSIAAGNGSDIRLVSNQGPQTMGVGFANPRDGFAAPQSLASQSLQDTPLRGNPSIPSLASGNAASDGSFYQQQFEQHSGQAGGASLMSIGNAPGSPSGVQPAALPDAPIRLSDTPLPQYGVRR